RRLGGLERNALQLAENQLPDVVGRLRRGENVDVNAEAPALRIGRDEIGRVGQAFDLVRQTAIRAAVEEARLRQGLNDVFRSLARRSQSLLHRQLSLLDQMERRATDPEALDDLFRLSQLAKRHGIRVTLKASPYGGTSAIVLIPQHLVVTDDAFRTGLPGEPAMAQLTANGTHAVPSISSMPAIPGELAGQGSGSGFTE